MVHDRLPRAVDDGPDGYRSIGQRTRRRLVTIPAVCSVAVVATVTLPLWLPFALVVDLVRARLRLPLVRLGVFGVCWSWIEVAGLLAAAGTWLTGRARHAPTQYAVQRRWADALMRALRFSFGVEPRIDGAEALTGGNAIVLTRHASLADSLLSAWAICVEAEVRPRYVLKRELLSDPCLDVVGLRVPNHFLDRDAGDLGPELAALRELATGVGPGVAAVIFPEGTRANDAKRARALARIAERDPARAERLAGLRRLLPPRPAGAGALVEGAPDADIVLAWHTGFDGLDTFSGVVSRLARSIPPVRFVARRVPRAEVPTGDAFASWLDEQWLAMDAEVDVALGAST